MRNITGTFSSGRIADVAVDPRNRSVWYVATASGGLWKTTNHGITFQPIFDDGGSYSLGCVTVDPKNPDIVWLGTGENQAQRAIGYGDGVYKSTDAGKTWKNMGLPNSEHIGKIWVDPRNPNVVWVAAQGPLFSPGGDRGLYKTTDGGQTWKPIAHDQREHRRHRFRRRPAQSRHHVRGRLPAAPPHQHHHRRRSGIGDLQDHRRRRALDASSPRASRRWTRAASRWPSRRRSPTWSTPPSRRTRGNKQTGLYRSEDAGAHWTKLSDFVVQDPEYYGEILRRPVPVRPRLRDGHGGPRDRGRRQDDHRGRLAGARRQSLADLRPDRPQSSDGRQRRRSLRDATTTAAPGGTSTIFR